MVRNITLIGSVFSLVAGFTLAAAPSAARACVSLEQPATPPADAAAPTSDKPPLKQEELEQLVAPIALYPDSLIAQILMASTYPLEIVEASRWAQSNKSLQGDALTKALESQDWDASVKSLVNFPEILSALSEKLDQTVKLGDAFLGQQKQVMDAVQTLRGKAKAAGNLESSQQQNVQVQGSGSSQTIIIEQSDPDVIYVPSYNPTVVYGSWPYPAYPPYSYYPPGAAALSFGVGVACGLAWGYACGGCNWGHGDIDIDVNRNVNRNTNIDRTKINANNRSGSFKHDPSHRKGVSYRNQATARNYGRAGDSAAAQSREQFRGRADQGRQDMARQGVNQGNVGRGDARAPNAGTRDVGAGNRGGAGSAGQNRPSQSGNGGAFSGADRGGQAARDNSNRGASSRGSSGASRPSSGSRPSGGGSRGGGGGRGGGGRR